MKSILASVEFTKESLIGNFTGYWSRIYEKNRKVMVFIAILLAQTLYINFTLRGALMSTKSILNLEVSFG